MQKEPKTLGSPSLDTLKDGCYAVKQVLKSLPKVGQAATSPKATRLSRPIARKLKLMLNASLRFSSSSARRRAETPATPSSALSRMARASWRASGTTRPWTPASSTQRKAVEYYEMA